MLTRDEIGQLFKRWYKPIRQWLRHGGSQLKAGGVSIDDLAQEVFVRLLRYQTREDIPAIDNIQGYLFRIAANVRNEWIERSVVRRMHAPELLDELIEDDEREPHALRESEDVQEALTRCMEQLTARQCSVLNAHVHEGLTYKQIATRERLTYRVVLRDLTRAYSRLRELMPNMEGGKDTPLPPHVQRLRELEQARLNAIAEREQKRGRGRPTLRQPELTAEKAISALEAHAYNISKAAESLGLKNTTLHFRLGSLIPDLDERRVQWRHDSKLRRQQERYQEKRREMLRARQQQRLAEEREELAAEAAQVNEAAETPEPEPETPEPEPELQPVGPVHDAAAMLAALEAHGYVFNAAAKALGMPAMTLHYRVRKHIPDLAAHRDRWIAEQRLLPENARKGAATSTPWLLWTSDAMLRTLEENRYSYSATAKVLGVTAEKVTTWARTNIADVDARGAAWKAERRAQLKLAQWQRTAAKQKQERAERRAAAEAEAAARPFPIVCGVAQDEFLRALESTDFVLLEAARVLGISEAKARHIHLRLVPDFDERREKAREALKLRQRAELIKILEQHQYKITHVCKLMKKSGSTMQAYVRTLLPDYAELRAEYLKQHSLGRCGGRIETPEEHEERLRRASEARSKAAREGNTRRANERRPEREAAAHAKLQKLESRRARMAELHRQEIAELRSTQEALHRQYMSMRKRQVKERRALNAEITRARAVIPNYREVFNLDELREQRQLTGRERKMTALDACGGDVHQAAALLGLHSTHIRKFKRDHWQPPELREQIEEGYDESENAAAAS